MDKLIGIISTIDAEYEKLAELQAEGDTTGFTAQIFDFPKKKSVRKYFLMNASHLPDL